MFLRIGLAEQYVFLEKIDEHWIGDVVVILHYFFIHRYNQKWIAWPVISSRFQDAVVKIIGRSVRVIRMPFHTLGEDIADGYLQLVH